MNTQNNYFSGFEFDDESFANVDPESGSTVVQSDDDDEFVQDSESFALMEDDAADETDENENTGDDADALESEAGFEDADEVEETYEDENA